MNNFLQRGTFIWKATWPRYEGREKLKQRNVLKEDGKAWELNATKICEI